MFRIFYFITKQQEPLDDYDCYLLVLADIKFVFEYITSDHIQQLPLNKSVHISGNINL